MRAWALVASIVLLATPVAAQDSAPSADELADRFEYALIAGDYRMLPVADGFTYVENGATLDPWDGMWQTTTALAGVTDPRDYPPATALDYRVEYAQGDTVIRLVESEEQTVHGLLAYRLVAHDGQIVRIDTLPIREEFTGARSGTVSLMQPMIPHTMDGALVGPVDPVWSTGGAVPDAAIRTGIATFFAAMDGKSPAPATAPDCARFDNGQPVTGVADSPVLDPAHPGFRPYALGCTQQLVSGFYANLELGALEIATDPARGLGIAMVRLDQAGTKLSFEAPGVGEVQYPGPRGASSETDTSEQFASRIAENMITPLSLNGIYLFKFDSEGRIERIEVFQRGAPYKWPGWNFAD